MMTISSVIPFRLSHHTQQLAWKKFVVAADMHKDEVAPAEIAEHIREIATGVYEDFEAEDRYRANGSFKRVNISSAFNFLPFFSISPFFVLTDINIHVHQKSLPLSISLQMQLVCCAFSQDLSQ
jgi:hypothetical protein